MTSAIDHLAVVARTLEEGSRWVEAALGVPLEPGGRHPLMGTWNRLLSLGRHAYLEVIAIDPKAAPPERPRWFGLDEFDDAPRLAAWVCRTDNLRGMVAEPGAVVAGHPIPQTRGELRWTLTVPDDGRLPMGGAHPMLIEWQGKHPAPGLRDAGIRLARLEVTHPDQGLAGLVGQCDRRVAFSQGPQAGLRAEFSTPGGRRWLG